MNSRYRTTTPKRILLKKLPLTMAICCAMAMPALAQDTPTQVVGTGTTASTVNNKAITLKSVTVTAQRRTEDVQVVPISINVLAGDQLSALNITDFQDYAAYLPTVSFEQPGAGGAAGPGFALISMRGIPSAAVGYNGAMPTVGVYLNDQPMTNRSGSVDIHLYDIARVEVLAGPQGTLYGASALSGALRILTNQPDPKAFAANYSISTDKVQHGGIGYTYQGMANFPLSSGAAVRLVAWNERDAGYIDNRAGTLTYPSSGITISNEPGCVPSGPGPTAAFQCSGHARNDYNDIVTKGARAALKVDLNDSWSITPTLMGQQTIIHGVSTTDPAIGDLAVKHFLPERIDDRWLQAALTVKGKIGNFDITYDYAHTRRANEQQLDYTDYSFWYDTIYGSGENWLANDGQMINPSDESDERNRFTNFSHEFRVTSPQDSRLRFVGGLFYQKLIHDITRTFLMNGLATDLAVTGWPNTLWLSRHQRFDTDKAAYGELSYDFVPDVLTGTIGKRYYRDSDSFDGFFGFSKGFAPHSNHGEAACVPPEPFLDAPCNNFANTVAESGSLNKYNLAWHMTPSAMLYVTRSEGYRPGGVNRTAIILPPYQADKLINEELGWKTTWFGNRLSFNGAIFHQIWRNFQFGVSGPNNVGETVNANSAKIDGIESDLNWQATYNLKLGVNVGYYNGKLTKNYCGFVDAENRPVTDCPSGSTNPLTGKVVSGPLAPAGTRMPVAPRFKGNVIARYEFSAGVNDAYVQAALVHVGERTTDLRLLQRGLMGDLPAYNTLDLSGGLTRNSWSVTVRVSNVLNKRGALYKMTECPETVCAAHGVVAQYPNGQVYTGFTVPRTFGVTFSQDF